MLAVDKDDNELYYLEVIHRLVEVMDSYFGSVCELDIVYNFEKAQFVLDELLMGGELLETDKLEIPKIVKAHDNLQEDNSQGVSFKTIIDELVLAEAYMPTPLYIFYEHAHFILAFSFKSYFYFLFSTIYRKFS
ncbi:hypothetical protein HZS_4773 [Henneguya salminicola]|nr:hypothetical protein HZS_4773 [Henneguya salminicola]